jgi:hypothetical protein
VDDLLGFRQDLDESFGLLGVVPREEGVRRSGLVGTENTKANKGSCEWMNLAVEEELSRAGNK